jgi:hypothetical protein
MNRSEKTMANIREEDDRQDEMLTIPVVPEKLGVDPVLLAMLHLTALLDFGDDDVVEPQVANEALEHVEMYMQRLSTERLEEVQAQLDKIEEYAAEAGWPEELTDFVRDFLYNCGLGEDDEDLPAEDE